MITPCSGPHGGTILTEERSSSLLVLYTDRCITCPLYTVQPRHCTLPGKQHYTMGQDTRQPCVGQPKHSELRKNMNEGKELNDH